MKSVTIAILYTAFSVLSVIALSGLTHARNAVWQDKVTLMEDTVRKSPGKARVWNNLGDAYAGKGRYGDAIGAIERSLQLDPAFADAYKNLGGVYGELGQYQEAVLLLRRAVELDDDYVDARYNLTMAYLLSGDRESAAKEYDELLKLSPEAAKEALTVIDELGLAGFRLK